MRLNSLDDELQPPCIIRSYDISTRSNMHAVSLILFGLLTGYWLPRLHLGYTSQPDIRESLYGQRQEIWCTVCLRMGLSRT